jgi:hypothetical protein
VLRPLSQAFPSASTLGEVALNPPSRLACLFTDCMGSAPSPLSSGTLLTTATVTSFSTPRLLDGCRHSCLLWPPCLFTVHVRKYPSPLLWWCFPYDSSCYKPFPLQGCWAGASPPVFSGWFIYSSSGECPPQSPELRVCRPLCYLSFFFQLLIIQVFFLFFPWVGVSLSRGLYWSGPELFVGVPCAA